MDYLYNIIGDDEDEILADVQECLKDLKSLGGEVWRPLVTNRSFQCRLGNHTFLQGFLDFVMKDREAALAVYSKDSFCSAYANNKDFREAFHTMLSNDRKAALAVYSKGSFCSAYANNKDFRERFHTMLTNDRKERHSASS